MAEQVNPHPIRHDNGPEFTARHFLSCCAQEKIQLLYIKPRKAMQN
jgi:transposase InsO family protein